MQEVKYCNYCHHQLYLLIYGSLLIFAPFETHHSMFVLSMPKVARWLMIRLSCLCLEEDLSGDAAAGVLWWEGGHSGVERRRLPVRITTPGWENGPNTSPTWRHRNHADRRCGETHCDDRQRSGMRTHTYWTYTHTVCLFMCNMQCSMLCFTTLGEVEYVWKCMCATLL